VSLQSNATSDAVDLETLAYRVSRECRSGPETLESSLFVSGFEDGSMSKQHSPQFLKIVADARSRVRECTVDEVKARLDQGESVHLVDVREESEFAAGHLPGACHLGKGVIERDIESTFSDPNIELVLYCGGGFRSALAADNLQKMGYTNVISMDGGWRTWTERGFPISR
jgi:rhodanese-related sulfurtransferase